MKLLQSQRNQIFEIIQEYGLTPIQFEIYDTRKNLNSTTINTKVKFKSSDFYFSFETSTNDKTDHTAAFSPGKDAYEETKFPRFWTSQIDTFKQWLEYLKREINAIDKWKRLDQEFSSLKINLEGDNQKFNFEEVKEIESKITLLQDRFKKFDLLPEQLNIMNQKLDSLSELAKDMNRFDWRSLFLGTIMSIIIQLNVTQENANLIWNAIKDVFSQYLLR